MALNAFGFVALAVACNTVNKILDRYVAKDVSPYAFSWLTQIVASLLLFPLALPYFALPVSGTAWMALAIAATLWTLVSVSVYIAIKKTQVSIKEPLSQSKIIWALILGLLLLGESVSTTKIVGTVVIFLGLCVLIFHPERKWGRLRDPDILWTLVSAVLTAIVAIVDKWALGFFRPELYGFLVYFTPCIILTSFLPKRIEHVKHLWKVHGKVAVSTIIFSTATYYFTLKAYALADITSIYPLLQLATIFAILCGIFILGEKEHKWQRFIAAIIVIIGAIIVKS